MEVILETSRLILREFILDDAPFIIELVNSPGWLQFIGDRNIHTKEEAVGYLKNGPLKSYADNGFGLCLVQIMKDHTPIGMCGIINRGTLDHPDIGFALLPEFMGNGYAFEISSALLEYAKNILQLPVILAITVPNNKSSLSLLEKLGLEFKMSFTFPGGVEELSLYSTPANQQ
jgi:RimJ/RimL family protein N-acetyltransferase